MSGKRVCDAVWSRIAMTNNRQFQPPFAFNQLVDGMRNVDWRRISTAC